MSNYVLDMPTPSKVRDFPSVGSSVRVHEKDRVVFKQRVSGLIRKGYRVEQMAMLYRNTGFGGVRTYSANLVK